MNGPLRFGSDAAASAVPEQAHAFQPVPAPHQSAPHQSPYAASASMESLERRLAELQAEQSELQAVLGCSSADEIISLVTGLRASIRELVDDARRRIAFESTLLAAHERFLA
jgi:hypothetical protein